MNVLLIDDDKLVCTSLKIILESEGITIVGIGHDGSDAIRLYQELMPDVLLMDIRMAKVSGIEAAEQILAKWKSAKILFLTTFSDDEYIVKALRLGARGYLLKQDYDSILPALKAVSIGQSVFGSEVINKFPSLMSSKKVFGYEAVGLTGKEYEIVEQVAEGKSNKEMAEILFLSEGTVRNYLSNILLKLELRDRTQLAIYYYKHIS